MLSTAECGPHVSGFSDRRVVYITPSEVPWIRPWTPGITHAEGGPGESPGVGRKADEVKRREEGQDHKWR